MGPPDTREIAQTAARSSECIKIMVGLGQGASQVDLIKI
jgi:hypothetical protein